jgi:hypothetical protein
MLNQRGSNFLAAPMGAPVHLLQATSPGIYPRKSRFDGGGPGLVLYCKPTLPRVKRHWFELAVLYTLPADTAHTCSACVALCDGVSSKPQGAVYTAT